MDTIEKFVGLSVVLTGFGKKVLAPLLDPVDIKSVYLKEWQDKVASESNKSDLTTNILTLFATLKAKNLEDENIGEQMLDASNGTDFVLACRKLIYLWYMGAWPAVNEAPGTETGGSTSFTTLSSDSYTSGLVWKVMQAHPMGDSNYRYGYWAEQPAPLTDYTGNKD